MVAEPSIYRALHQILLNKLEQMKITGKVLNWITTFLTNRSQIVVVNGNKSSPTKVASGVPQGTDKIFMKYL